MEILVTSTIIPYIKILYPHMGPPTTLEPHGPHHLNPALGGVLITHCPSKHELTLKQRVAYIFLRPIKAIVNRFK